MKKRRLFHATLLTLLAIQAPFGCGGGDSNPVDEMMGDNDPPILTLVFHENAIPPPSTIVTEVKDLDGTDAIPALGRVWNGVARMEVSIYLRQDEPDLGTDSPTTTLSYDDPVVSLAVIPILPCNLHSGPTWVSVSFFEAGGTGVETVGPASPTSDCA